MKMAEYKATVGTISHGTLRAEDLVITFADELRRFVPDHDRVKEADAVQTLWARGWESIYEDEPHIDALLSDLITALDEHAPPYCYFGTNEGDGSDFGYWPSMEQIEELPNVDHAAIADYPNEDHKYVNDHGNVTVYGADGSVLLELV
jgi:hypothetical protein